MLLAGVPVNTHDEQGETALHWAAYNNLVDVVNNLLKNEAIKNGFGSTPLHWAAGNNNMKVVKILLQHGADPTIKDEDSNTPLSWAFRSRSEEVIQLLKQIKK